MAFFTVILFSVIYFFSCSKQIEPSDTQMTQQVYENYSSIKLKKEIKDQLENFVFLLKETHISICDSEEAKDGECFESVVPDSSASGVVVSSSRTHIFVLTANHFCENPPVTNESPVGIKKIILKIGNTSRDASVVLGDQKNDICLLQALKSKDENFKKIKIAKKMPDIGDKVLNVAAPNGMASPHTKLVFDGFFGGCEDDVCIFTIPATFGSSGSAIYNLDGELISLIVAAPITFENAALGPNARKIKLVLEAFDNIVDIY